MIECDSFSRAIHWLILEYIHTLPPIEIGMYDTVKVNTNCLIVQSARARIENGDGKKGSEDFLALHGIIVDEVTNIKPPSFIYIDDRGFRFKGDWREVLDFIHGGLYHPWNNVQKL